MNYSVIIPAHNEEAFIGITLQSLTKQSVLPTEVIVVNDHSSDKTPTIVEQFARDFPWIRLVNRTSKAEHQPGSKVILAFLAGLPHLTKPYDILVKLDADLDLPLNYFEQIVNEFSRNPKAGILGGHAYIEKNNQWQLEQLTDPDHVRGAFKSYRKEVYDVIGGLRPQMGWDTVDELLAKYHNWDVYTLTNLKVKHLKPTGANYQPDALLKQGGAYYTLGYGFWITTIAALKLALNKRKPLYFFRYLQGYFGAKNTQLPKMVNREEEQFIRQYRWHKILEKLGVRKSQKH